MPPQPAPSPEPGEPYTLSDLMPGPTPPAASPPAQRTGAWTTVGAGVAVIVGSFLPWASITVPIVGTVTASGADGTDGWVTAAIGALLALHGAATLRKRLPITVDTLAVLAGLSVAGIAVWKIVDLRSSVEDMRRQMSANRDEFGFADALANAVHARVGVGLWLLIAAGLTAAAYVGYTIVKRR
jgi:membrane-associated protease RseP (regulator of RpoE activity)